MGICEEAEALQNETNWQETANKLITLQEKWKTAGYYVLAYINRYFTPSCQRRIVTK